MTVSALAVEAGGTAAAAPGTTRIEVIDVLRGAATLGILVINIAVFAMPFAMDDPINYGGTDSADLRAWAFNKLFFEGSMRAIFSMLFGASALLLLQTLERDPARRQSAPDIYYRRTLWLAVFGVGHGVVLLWPGDVLYVYGLAGLMLFPFRNVRASRLLLIGAIVLASMIARYGFWLYEDLHVHNKAVASQVRVERNEATEEDLQNIKDWNAIETGAHPDRKRIKERIEGMRGGYVRILKTTLPSTKYEQSWKTYDLRIWDALTMMFLGMALLKYGVLTGQRGWRFYFVMSAAGYTLGFALKTWEITTLLQQNFSALAQSITRMTYEVSRLGVGIGHVGVVMLACRAKSLAFLHRPLAAVGRMALTNYIAQTVLCVLVFYGIGLGWYGTLQRFQLYYVVAGIWALQLIWSTLWLRAFRFGPLEWLWRSLTYWRVQPLKGAARE